MPSRELSQFLEAFDHQASNITSALRALPEGRYDFRFHPESRSLGELAWHLAELEAYMGHAIEHPSEPFSNRPQRPREIAALAPGYERVHADAVASVRKLKIEDLDRRIPFFGGREMEMRRILWDAILHHSIHHLGQLIVMIRLADGIPPGLYGPNREESAVWRAQQAAKTTG